jgi:hypothetical protein
METTFGIPEVITSKNREYYLRKKKQQKRERIYKIIAWCFAGLFLLEIIGVNLFARYILSTI